MIELKPCPLCGAKAKIGQGHNKDYAYAYITCENKKCNCAIMGMGDTEEEAVIQAVDWWNERSKNQH